MSCIDADIYIVQECEDPEYTRDLSYKSWAQNYYWIGDSKNKGLAIFARDHILLEKLDWSNNYQDHSVKYFLPCSVDGVFDLLAVWTHKNNSPNFGYIGQFWKYLQINRDKFGRILIVGDFNSNVIWDEWDRWWNHSDVVNELSYLGIKSFYHEYTGENQGEETQPTFYLHKNSLKPYHIDYVFGSIEFLKTLKKVEISNSKDWLKISDHLPVICEI